MKIALVVAGVLAGLVVVGVTGLWVAARIVPRPSEVGKPTDRLSPCPASPNCVSSQGAGARHAAAPLPYTGSLDEALARLVRVLKDQKRTVIVTRTDTYVHAEARSALFRFVDDVEFVLDDREKVVHFRSASRVGRSDYGVNRARMERIRAAFTASVD